MVTSITKNVKITVETAYKEEYSTPERNHYVFTYRITIENQADKTIQLKLRHCDIFYATFLRRAVDGEGVTGKQPILEPGQIHQYVSGCNLRSGIGKMQGYFIFEQIIDGARFNVSIPAFVLIDPVKLN